MAGEMFRITGSPSCPFPHPGVMQLLGGRQQTANKPLSGAENVLDLVPLVCGRGGSLY